MADIEQLVSTAKAQITTCDDLQQLEEIRTSYLGKKGALTAELKNLGQLSAEERPAQGKLINIAKRQVTEALEARKSVLNDQALASALSAESIDITEEAIARINSAFDQESPSNPLELSPGVEQPQVPEQQP